MHKPGSNLEIERKFLLPDGMHEEALREKAHEILVIEQGYLSDEDGRKIRIRMVNREKAIITFKGPARQVGQSLVREEHEDEIDAKAGSILLAQCKRRLLKVRHHIFENNLLVEADVFMNLPGKLAMAEIEIDDPHAVLDLPRWLGREVTEEAAYGNARLVKGALAYERKALEQLLEVSARHPRKARSVP